MATKQKKRTWKEKRDAVHEGYPKIVDVPGKWARTIGHGKMVVLTPVIINKFIKTVPKGKLVTINLMREKFATDFNVDITCPLTTGIFVWICAGAAEEEKVEGKKQITPYWRVLKEGGKLNPKFPGGVRQQAKYLVAEGFQIQRAEKDAAWSVKNYKQFLFKI